MAKTTFSGPIKSLAGFISAGNPRPTGITGTNKGFYVQGDTGVSLAGNAAGGHIKFDGTNTSISGGYSSETTYQSGSSSNTTNTTNNSSFNVRSDYGLSGTSPPSANSPTPLPAP